MAGTSSITKVNVIRLKNEVSDWIREKDSRRVVESLYEMIKMGKLYVDSDGTVRFSKIERHVDEHGEDKEERSRIRLLNRKIAELRSDLAASRESVSELEKKLDDAVDVSADLANELSGMGRPYGMTLDSMLKEVISMLSDGRMGISADGMTVGTVDECPFSWRLLTEACDEMCVGYEEAVKKAAQMIYRGGV